MHDYTLKPYLIQAFYNWSINFDYTPHLEIVQHPLNKLPSFLEDKDVFALNISQQATQDLSFEEEGIYFITSFLGQHEAILISYFAIRKIFTIEEGKALEFSSFFNEPDPKIHLELNDGKDKKHHLILVKNDNDKQ